MILLLICLNSTSVMGCTTAIISGKFTIDGRPLLFKNRDTDDLQNKLMFFNDGKYEYIGLVDSKDIIGKCVWAGCNSMGFAIMNSATYNLNMSDTTSIEDRGGLLMKEALQTCASLEDFERLLKAANQPIGLQANFGVIDAKGGAAYYEVGNNKCSKFDANDPSTAPFGYIIRTNYSYVGDRKEDYGFIRYQTAEELFNLAYSTHSISFQFLIKDVSRCLKNSLTKVNLTENIPANFESARFIDYQDFIVNYYTSASFVVQGVKKDESPSLSTIWTVLGFPLCSVAIPTWIKGGKELPLVVQADTSGNAPICNMALELKKKIFPLIKGYSRNYINLSVLLNQNNDGILQKLVPLENMIMNEAEQKIKRWRSEGMEIKEIQKFYHYIDNQVKEVYKKDFCLN